MSTLEPKPPSRSCYVPVPPNISHIYGINNNNDNCNTSLTPASPRHKHKTSVLDNYYNNTTACKPLSRTGKQITASTNNKYNNINNNNTSNSNNSHSKCIQSSKSTATNENSQSNLYSDEESLYNNIMNITHSTLPPIQPHTIHSRPNTTDTSLISSMTQRIIKLEQLTQLQQQKINELQTYLDSNVLHIENQQLKQQIDDMNKFLNDYDLQWVGDTDQNNHNDTINDSLVYFDVNQLQQCISELNNRQSHTLHNTSNIASFTLPIRIQLTIYKNGIYINNGPLRPYTVPESHDFIDDILHRNIPAELIGLYPNGCIIELMDQSTHILTDTSYTKHKFTAFNGNGNVLSRRQSRQSTNISNDTFNLSATHIQTNNTVAGYKSIYNHIDRHMTAEQFVARLPVSTVSNGTIHNIRANVAQLIHPATNTITPSTITQAVQSSRTTTTIQCKFDNGHAAQKLVLNNNASIADLRAQIHDILSSYTNENTIIQYEIRTLYPAKVYNDDRLTLEQAGLTPNSTILLRTIH